MLEEAAKAGVLRITTKNKAKNPNKWEKHLAPWFDDNCKHARDRYRRAVKRNGKNHAHATNMFKAFVNTCKQSRAKLLFTLPEMLK